MKVWRRDGSKETEAEVGYFSLKLCENTGRMAENRSGSREKQQGNAASGEACKLHRQLLNEGSLNRSSGTRNHSSHRHGLAAGLRSTTLMVIDGALSLRAEKCLSYTTGHSPASKPHHHMKTQQSKPSEEIQYHRTGPLRYCEFSMLCFLMCEYPESQPRGGGVEIKAS